MIELKKDTIKLTTPEGEKYSLPVDKAVKLLNPSRMETCGTVLPDGVKYVLSTETGTIWVHQTPPKVHNFKWCKDGENYSNASNYRNVRVALPYVLIFARFVRTSDGKLHISGQNECFFSNEPIKSPRAKVFYPALLNCSKWPKDPGHPLSWICTAQHDLKSMKTIKDDNARLRAGFEAVRSCLFETGFNRSSEANEGESWFRMHEKAGIIKSVEHWEAATKKGDPLSATTVNWLPTNRTVENIARRILSGYKEEAPKTQVKGTDVSRVVTMHGKKEA